MTHDLRGKAVSCFPLCLFPSDLVQEVPPKAQIGTCNEQCLLTGDTGHGQGVWEPRAAILAGGSQEAIKMVMKIPNTSHGRLDGMCWPHRARLEVEGCLYIC